MKPYGREKKVKGTGSWKTDYHIHHKNKKIGNWWEDICNFLTRSRMKQLLQKDIDLEINEK